MDDVEVHMRGKYAHVKGHYRTVLRSHLEISKEVNEEIDKLSAVRINGGLTLEEEEELDVILVALDAKRKRLKGAIQAISEEWK